MHVEVLQLFHVCLGHTIFVAMLNSSARPSSPARGLTASGFQVSGDWRQSPSHRVCLGSKAVTRELGIASLRTYEHGVPILRPCRYQIVDSSLRVFQDVLDGGILVAIMLNFLWSTRCFRQKIFFDCLT